MRKNKFSLQDGKVLNIDQIQGKMTAFERMEHPVTLRLSCPLSESGYGTVTVDGVEVPRGKEFTLGKGSPFAWHCLTIPVGMVVQEYEKEYSLKLTGFVGNNGKPFADTTFKIKTLPRTIKEYPYSYEAHDAVAMQAALESMVLLKNDGHALPLSPDSHLNLFGRGQYIFYNTATGAGLINPRWQASIHQAIAEHSHFKLNQEISELYKTLETVIPDADILTRARNQSDTGIVVLSRVSGEFTDNRPVPNHYYLTKEERGLLKTVSHIFPKAIVVINSGYPIELGWIPEFGINAVIYTGFAGQAATYALMEILDGRFNPCGKLPDSFPWDYYDQPSAVNFPNLKAEDPQPGGTDFGVHIYYEEDIYVGYRYFDTFKKDVAFSFGHGLSYTVFSIQFQRLSWNGDCVHVDATITNIGNHSGKEVVQLYIAAPEGTLEKPYRVLAAFEKTRDLSPGETEILHLTAHREHFSSFDENRNIFLLEAGTYSVFGGNSLQNAVKIGSFHMDAEAVISKVAPICRNTEDFHRLTKADPTVKADSKILPLEDRIKFPASRSQYTPEPLPAYHGKRIDFPTLKENPALIDKFVAQMSNSELCKMSVCGGSNWYLPWQNGAAGKNIPLKKYKIPLFTVADGNTGVNIKKRNIGFPSSAGIAATFNRDLAYQVGKVIAEESKENGIQLNLGPAMNIHRNILNGRHPEYFSEDPYLAGVMAGNHGKGLEENGCGCCYKHLFCNGSDTSRQGNHSIVSQRALREIYFKAFEIAKEVHAPSALMTSYNALNGIYPAENPDILQKLIRDEWGLDSFIMTDWGTYLTVDPVEMTKAGNNWLTEGGTKYVRILKKAVKEGRLSRAVLEQNAKYLVNVLLKWCTA